MIRLALLLLTCSTVLPAAGKLIINGTTVSLTHVYSRRAPSTFDTDKTILYILAVDRELSPSVRVERDDIWNLSMAGKLNAIEFELSDDSARWILRTNLGKGVSGSRPRSPFNLQTANDRVKGNLTLAEPATLGDNTYIFDIAVDTEIEKPIVELPPTAADRAAAADSPVTKAFLAYVAALRKGDKEAILKAIDPEKATMARNSPEWPKILAMIQDMEPTDIVVEKATIAGDDAVLMVTGLNSKKLQTGKVTMMRLNNQWLVKKEAWKNKP